MSTETYIYVADPVDLLNIKSNVEGMTIGDVKGNITGRLERGGITGAIIAFIDDDNSSRRTAFDMMLRQLKKGTIVIMWSWQCLINRGRPEWACFDVLDALRKIHEHECSVSFLREDVVTATPAGRLFLNNLIAMAQYHYDFAIEQEKAKAAQQSTPNCCSSSGSRCVTLLTMAEISSKHGSGC